MEQKLIEGTGLVSSRIALGTWSLGGWMWGGSDEGEAIKTIRTALDLGITLIDTAPVYGFGRSEELVGRAIAGHGGRERVLIATKAGLEWRAGEVYRNASGTRIRREIEDSLRRLRTSYIDIYQVHWPDPLVPIEETAAALRELFERGTIGAIGVSNFSPEQMEAFSAVAPLHVVQPPYNLFERQIEKNVLPYAERHGLTVLAYGAICRGLLSGRMRPDTRFTGDDLRQTDPKFQPRRYGQYLDAVAALGRLARARWQGRSRPGGSLDPGPGADDCAVGRTTAGPALTDRRRARLEPRRGHARDDRSHPGRDRHGPRRPGVHGPPGSRRGRRPGARLGIRPRPHAHGVRERSREADRMDCVEKNPR